VVSEGFFSPLCPRFAHPLLLPLRRYVEYFVDIQSHYWTRITTSYKDMKLKEITTIIKFPNVGFCFVFVFFFNVDEAMVYFYTEC